MQSYNALLAKKLLENFKKRNFEGVYCETKEAALAHALSLLEPGCTVSCGGSLTLREIGLHDALKSGFMFLDPAAAQGGAEMERVAREAMSADVYFLSANAIAQTGELVHIDGIGNRAAALMFGPKRVVVIAGMNKIAHDLDDAIARARTQASRLCLLGYHQDYKDMDELDAACKQAESHLLITSGSVMKGRTTVILVGEQLGY